MPGRFSRNISLSGQVMFFILWRKGFIGDGAMRLIRAFILLAICVLLFSPVQASAWFWPILGDPGPCPGFEGGPGPVLPGTAEWALQPMCGARLFPFGYPYGAIRGNLNFGFMPPFI